VFCHILPERPDEADQLSRIPVILQASFDGATVPPTVSLCLSPGLAPHLSGRAMPAR